MDLAVRGRWRFLQGGDHHLKKGRIPIRRFPQRGIGQGGDYDHRPALDPEKQQHKPEEPNHGVHDRQADELWRPDQTEEEAGLRCHA